MCKLQVPQNVEIHCEAMENAHGAELNLVALRLDLLLVFFCIKKTLPIFRASIIAAQHRVQY